MRQEFEALIHNNTWKLFSLSPTIGSKWVYKVKLFTYLLLDKYKSWIMAKGYHQKHGIDYFETFLPVVKAQIIRVVLIIVVLLS